MSELINNSEKRKELLKHMILELHKGQAPEMVKARLAELLAKIPYDEVVEVEQELINGGLPAEEVLQFCDIHTLVLEGKIDQTGAKPIPIGHPVDTFIQENRELKNRLDQAEELFGRISSGQEQGDRDFVLAFRKIFNDLMDVDKHYRRKEYLVFPFLEKYNITGPPTVMWGKHDETRGFLKTAFSSLESAEASDRILEKDWVEKNLMPATKAIGDMILKEEEILFPMCMDRLTEMDWYHVHQQTLEFGYCLFDPQTDWKPEHLQMIEVKDIPTGTVQLPSGHFKVEELLAIFNTLPIDITFVDKDDKVRFFSTGPDRIFARNRAILGRDVRMCHPPSSVNVVEQILQDFKSGRENSAPFWIQLHGKMIYIEYFALRDEQGNYLGTIEFSQDLTKYRALEGEQRLLSYSTKPQNTEVMQTASNSPSWLTEDKIKVRLDARPLLAQGIHPLEQVIQLVSGLQPGEILELTTPFLPEPMIQKISEMGDECFSSVKNGLHLTYFRKGRDLL